MFAKTILSEKFSIFLVFVGGGLFIGFITAFLWNSYIFDFNQSIDSEKFGQFGDIVGGVIGSIWALAGVILFYISLKEQRKIIDTSIESIKQQEIALKQQQKSIDIQNEDLELQRDEIQKTRAVLEEQRNVAKEQSIILKAQHFESNFYALVELNQKIKSNLLRSHEGKNHFSEIVGELRNNLVNSWCPVSSYFICKKKYLQVFFKHKDVLGHYFKTIDRVFQTVENSQFDDSNKFFYLKTLRSQLTESELILLYYHSTTEFGDTLYSFSLKYNIFKHLPFTSKLECNFLTCDNFDSNSSRIVLIKKLDQYLSEQLKYLSDITTEENRLSHEIKTDRFIFIIELIDDGDMQIVFHFQDDKILKALSLRANELISFLEFYLYDRLFFSHYIDCEDLNNKIVVTKRETLVLSDKVEFIIKTTRDVYLCADRY